jgi:hypothetical protein
MPIVSVNLSEQAYNVYRGWKHHRNGSSMTSSAIMQYDVRRCDVAMLELGDRRTLTDGTKLVWTDNGWRLE